MPMLLGDGEGIRALNSNPWFWHQPRSPGGTTWMAWLVVVFFDFNMSLDVQHRAFGNE